MNIDLMHIFLQWFRHKSFVFHNLIPYIDILQVLNFYEELYLFFVCVFVVTGYIFLLILYYIFYLESLSVYIYQDMDKFSICINV